MSNPAIPMTYEVRIQCCKGCREKVAKVIRKKDGKSRIKVDVEAGILEILTAIELKELKRLLKGAVKNAEVLSCLPWIPPQHAQQERPPQHHPDEKQGAVPSRGQSRGFQAPQLPHHNYGERAPVPIPRGQFRDFDASQLPHHVHGVRPPVPIPRGPFVNFEGPQLPHHGYSDQQRAAITGGQFRDSQVPQHQGFGYSSGNPECANQGMAQYHDPYGCGPENCSIM